jgi:hypothetical protein
MSELTDRTLGLGKEAATFAKDAAYIAVGLGVLGFQKLQAERVAMQKRVPQIGIAEEGWNGLRAEVGRKARHFDEFVGVALDKFESSVKPLEEQLPDSAREAAAKAHASARQLRSQVSRLVSSVG